MECDKFVRLHAADLRRRRARTGDKWHLDEVFLNINGVRHYLWRAVDQNGIVIDILVSQRVTNWPLCDCFRKLLQANTRSRPRVIVTDKLRNYTAPKRVVMPGVAHWQHR